MPLPISKPILLIADICSRLAELMKLPIVSVEYWVNEKSLIYSM
jgi:hypothetical protein